jgi:hypothetical protein
MKRKMLLLPRLVKFSMGKTLIKIDALRHLPEVAHRV